VALISSRQTGASVTVATRHKKHFDFRLFLLGNERLCGYAGSTPVPPIDPNTLPRDVDVLRKIVVDLCEQLRHESSEKDQYRSLLRELLDAQRNRQSEQLSKEQLDLFEALWKASDPEEESEPARAGQARETASKEA
jgi:hypothetical protein